MVGVALFRYLALKTAYAVLYFFILYLIQEEMHTYYLFLIEVKGVESRAHAAFIFCLCTFRA